MRKVITYYKSEQVLSNENIGSIVGYALPAFNGFNIQMELLMTAKKLNLVDENRLKSVYKE